MSRRLSPKEAGADLASRIAGEAGAMVGRRAAQDVIRGLYRSERNVRLALDLCTECGACLTRCPTYISTGDPLNSPIGRISIARSMLRGSASDDESYRYAWLCLTCGACSTACPFGLDVPGVSRALRAALLESGRAPSFISSRVLEQLETSRGRGFDGVSLEALVHGITSEIAAEKGLEAHPKVDEHADVLLVVPSDDLVLNVETLKGYISVLHELGADFSLSSRAVAENYGLFLHPSLMRDLADSILAAANELGASTIVMGECGNAWRVAVGYLSAKLRGSGVEVRHVFHVVADALRSGELELDPDANGDLVYEYQDPCQYSRGGRLVREPREILRNVVRRYVEPSLGGQRTVCCGAGGGNLAPELLPLTTDYSELWYEMALSDGADVVVRPCAICKSHMSRVVQVLNSKYGRNISISGLMELVYRALVPHEGRRGGFHP
ncbi:MAG: (Fe-S)-binding protein [Conexivisphaera sp.]